MKEQAKTTVETWEALYNLCNLGLRILDYEDSENEQLINLKESYQLDGDKLKAIKELLNSDEWQLINAIRL